MNARFHTSVRNPAGLTVHELEFFLHIIDILAMGAEPLFVCLFGLR